jgi:hypothetical protein
MMLQSENRRGPVGGMRLPPIAARLEQLPSPVDRCIRAVLDLQPGRRDPVGFVSAVAPLGDDALKVAGACRSEQVHAAGAQIVDVEQSGLNSRHDAAQAPLALGERTIAEILAIDREHVERVEARPVAAEQQFVEVAAAVAIEADDLAVEDARHRPNAVRNFRFENPELTEDVAAARDQAAQMSVDVRKRAEAVMFQLEQPIRMIEGLWNPNERHRPVSGRVHIAKPIVQARQTPTPREVAIAWAIEERKDIERGCA